MITILMVSAKIAALGLIQLKIFWNKSNNVKIFVYEVTKKIFLRESNYIVDVVMWPKLGDCSISMGEVVITLVL